MRGLIDVYRQNEKISFVVSYLLVAGMMFCLGVTAAYLLERFLPERDSSYLPIFCFFVSLIGIYSQRKVRHTSELNVNPVVYRVVEWIVILVILKLTIYAWNGMGQLITDLPEWRSNFLESFLQADYVLAILVVMMVWSFTLMYVEDLADLEGDADILEASTLDSVVRNRSIVQARMATHVMTIGIGLVILSSLTRLDFSKLFPDLQVGRQNSIHVLVYFLFGLVLLSLTQLASRRAVWAWEHIQVGEGITRNWILYSLGFLVVLSILAFTLPTGYTMGLLPTLSYALNFIFALVYSVVVLVLLPIFLLIAWLLSLVGIGKGAKTPRAMPEQIFPPLPDDLASSSSPFLAILKNILFWGTLVFLLIYAFSVYFRQNKELIVKLRQIPGLAWLANVWRWLVDRARVGILFLPNAAMVGIMRLRSSLQRRPENPWGGYLNLRSLEPRQKILFYYLALIRRSGEAGFPRAGWQTPSQYADTLKANLPDSTPEIDTMTNNFEEARYSQHLVTTNQVGTISRAWDHLRTQLRRRFKLR
jgi:hypothetical protein